MSGILFFETKDLLAYWSHGLKDIMWLQSHRWDILLKCRKHPSGGKRKKW